MDVWLNGAFVDRDAARISIFDAGVQHAVGLFETMGAQNGRVFRAREHVRRLIDSASTLLLSERLHEETGRALLRLRYDSAEAPAG